MPATLKPRPLTDSDRFQFLIDRNASLIRGHGENWICTFGSLGRIATFKDTTARGAVDKAARSTMAKVVEAVAKTEDGGLFE